MWYTPACGEASNTVRSAHCVGETVFQMANGVSHAYRLEAVRDAVRRDGEPTLVLTWTGRCAACGAEFPATSGPAIRPYMIRGCPAHRPWVTARAPDAVAAKRQATWRSRHWMASWRRFQKRSRHV